MRFLFHQAVDDAHRLRELAAWYRDLAERAGSPVIWEGRLLLAEDLDAAAARIESDITLRFSRDSDD